MHFSKTELLYPDSVRLSDGVYEVEHIIDHRPAVAGPEALDIDYLVKWTGFDRADATREPI